MKNSQEEGLQRDAAPAQDQIGRRTFWRGLVRDSKLHLHAIAVSRGPTGAG
ncbi:MAG: hypothetical protein ACLUUO_15920 [Sellimonas intestinalis]